MPLSRDKCPALPLAHSIGNMYSVPAVHWTCMQDTMGNKMVPDSGPLSILHPEGVLIAWTNAAVISHYRLR